MSPQRHAEVIAQRMEPAAQLLSIMREAAYNYKPESSKPGWDWFEVQVPFSSWICLDPDCTNVAPSTSMLIALASRFEEALYELVRAVEGKEVGSWATASRFPKEPHP